MLHTKALLPLCSRDENVGFTIYGHGSHFGRVTLKKKSYLGCLIEWMVQMKIVSNGPVVSENICLNIMVAVK